MQCDRLMLNRSSDLQRLMNAMRQAHADGWFIVFDTLTLADDRLEAFYDNPNALRDYFRDIGRMVLDRKSGSAGMPRPISYAVFCLKKKKFKAAGHKVNTWPLSWALLSSANSACPATTAVMRAVRVATMRAAHTSPTNLARPHNPVSLPRPFFLHFITRTLNSRLPADISIFSFFFF